MKERHLSEEETLARRRRALGITTVLVILALLLGLGWLLGRPLMDAVRNKESFRDWLQAQGFLKYFIMCGLMIVQILIAVIPGGPIEVAAGYAFGPWLGTVICVAGSALGAALVFFLARRYGLRLVRVFVSQKKLDSFAFLQDEKKLKLSIFILFLVPGVPKDILTYVAGITPIGMGAFIWLSTAARFPSILLSAMGGHSLGEENYRMAVIIVAVGLALTLILGLLYRRYGRHKAAGSPKARDSKEETHV
ncbi:MAG: TVP38/TMEM64 family protein [Christensenellales bacterium]